MLQRHRGHFIHLVPKQGFGPVSRPLQFTCYDPVYDVVDPLDIQFVRAIGSVVMEGDLAEIGRTALEPGEAMLEPVGVVVVSAAHSQRLHDKPLVIQG